MGAVAVTTAGPAGLGVEDLSQLMRSVNETTERLRRTHVTLQEEVVRLRGELAEANEQLRRSRSLAALGEMAAGIAHEVRNPLASIGLYAQMLAEDVSEPQPAELCRRIGRAVHRLDAIVRDVLLFAREDAARPQPVDAADLVARALESCRPVLEAAGVAVENRCGDAGTARLEADPTLVEQALSNLIRNAAEAMAEAEAPLRRIVLSCAAAPRRVSGPKRVPCVVLSVEDSGPGLSEEVQRRMFNPFFTTRRTGTGLGLAIVHRITDAHGGRVDVTTRPGDGTTVALCLPAGGPARRRGGKEVSADRPPAGPRRKECEA